MISATKIHQFSGHRQSIYCIDQIDDFHFVSSGSDGLIVIWKTDKADGEVLASLPEPVFSSFYHNGLLYTGTRGGIIYVFDIPARKWVRQWQAHPSAIFAITAFNGNIVSAAEDGTIKTWDHLTSKPLGSTLLSQKSIRCLFPSDNRLYAGSSDSRILALDADLHCIQNVKAHEPSVFSIVVTGSHLFSAGRDALIRKWNTDLTETQVINAHWYTIHSLALSSDGKYLASGSMDKSVKIWDSATMQLLKVIDFEKYQAHTSSVNKLVWMDDEHLLSCSDDRSICLFRISDD